MQSNTFLSKYLQKQSRPRNLEIESNRQTQDQGEESSSLQNIHLKLQEETDKIVKWKVSTEISLNQKERELAESLKVNLKLRNHLMEQQLNAESLSHDLLREKNQREQIEEHAQRTRVLCYALQERHYLLEVVVGDFNGTRDGLQRLYDDLKEQVENLGEKFNKLSLQHQDVVNEMSIRHENVINDITFKAESEVRLLTEDRDVLIVKLSQKENALLSHNEEIDFNKLLLQEFSYKIFAHEEQFETLRAKHNWTSNEFDKVNENFKTASRDFEERNQYLETLVSEMENKLKITDKKLIESRGEFEEAAEKVKFLADLNANLENSKENALQELEMMISLKNELQKDLELTAEKLNEVLDLSTRNEVALREEIVNLNNNIQQCGNELETKTEEIDDLRQEGKEVREMLQVRETEFQEEKSNLEKYILEKNEEIRNLKEDLLESQKKNDLLEAQNATESSKLESCIEELDSVKEKLIHSENGLKLTTEEIDGLKINFHEQTMRWEITLESEKNLISQIDSLTKWNEDLKENVDKLQVANKDFEKKLNSEKKSLTSELKKISNLKTRNKVLQQKLNERENEIKIEKETFDKSAEELKFEISELEKQRDDLNFAHEELKNEKERTERDLQEELEKAKEEIKKAEEERDEKANEATVAEQEANNKILEMMALAEIWKKKNEVEIDSKNAEIETIKKEVEDLKESLAQNLKEKNILLNLKSKLEDYILTKDEELTTLKKELTEQTKEFTYVKTAIKSLTRSPKRKFDDALCNQKTSTPTTYISVAGNPNEAAQSGRGGESPEGKTISDISNDGSMKWDKSTAKSRSSILKPTVIREIQHSKNVSFLSPVYYPPDSDSSEGFAVDVQSDSDDRFEAIKRSTNVRYCHPAMGKSIPKANICPIPREPTPQPVNQGQTRDTRGNASTKRPRYDRTSLRTYVSPKGKK